MEETDMESNAAETSLDSEVFNEEDKNQDLDVNSAGTQFMDAKIKGREHRRRRPCTERN